MVNGRAGVRAQGRQARELHKGSDMQGRHTPYLSVKCSTLGLEGEEELGAR